MITSHETRGDFLRLLRGIKDMAQQNGVDFSPEYTMQDA